MTQGEYIRYYYYYYYDDDDDYDTTNKQMNYLVNEANNEQQPSLGNAILIQAFACTQINLRTVQEHVFRQSKLPCY